MQRDHKIDVILGDFAVRAIDQKSKPIKFDDFNTKNIGCASKPLYAFVFRGGLVRP